MGAWMWIWQPVTSARSLAGRSVLLQVKAQQRQFAVWFQEMTLEDYLQHIKQKALASRDVCRPVWEDKVRQPSLWGEGA